MVHAARIYFPPVLKIAGAQYKIQARLFYRNYHFWSLLHHEDEPTHGVYMYDDMEHDGLAQFSEKYSHQCSLVGYKEHTFAVFYTMTREDNSASQMTK
mgnify:FL=1